MTLITDSTDELRTHANELLRYGFISREEADELHQRIDSLERDLQQMYDREDHNLEDY